MEREIDRAVEPLKQSARVVQDALHAAGIECSVEQLPASTRSAREAAKAIGCTVAQIAKSILFKTKRSNRAILIIASGINRIDESLVALTVGEDIKMATPNQVREATGYAIGGVPPCGHIGEVEVYLDKDLFELDLLWAAAGTPNAVFKIQPTQLETLTQGRVIQVTNGKEV